MLTENTLQSLTVQEKIGIDIILHLATFPLHLPCKPNQEEIVFSLSKRFWSTEKEPIKYTLNDNSKRTDFSHFCKKKKPSCVDTYFFKI